MSKRAEELWKQILDHFSANNWHLNERVMLALINAELRRERERCAARFRNRIGQWSPMSPGMVTIKETLLTDGIAVILADEEE